MRHESIGFNGSDALFTSLFGDVQPVSERVYTHTFELHGKPLGRCVSTDFSTTPWTMTLELMPGVDPEEIKKMALFYDLNVKFV